MLLIIGHTYRVLNAEHLLCLRNKLVVFQGYEHNSLMGLVASVNVLNNDGSLGEEWHIKEFYLVDVK